MQKEALGHETSKRNKSDSQKLVITKIRLGPLKTPFLESPTHSGFPYRYFLFQLLCYPVGYTIKSLHTTAQVGGTNLFDVTNYQVDGAPSFGRIVYFGLLFDIK